MSMKPTSYDPVLRTYRTRGCRQIFNASGFFGPISIKDQVIRIQQIIDRALKYDLINDRGKKLLVLGAGAAGMAAAVYAVNKNVKTVLVERKNNFSGHLYGSKRHTCPTQYDWTSTDWEKGLLDLHSIHPQLIFKAGRASMISGNLVNAINDLILSHGHLLTLDYGTKIDLSARRYHGGRIIVSLLDANTGAKKQDDDFDMILICAGFPRERVNYDTFYGVPFWEFTDHHIFSGHTNRKILICGGGDGSLQDFLLLAVREYVPGWPQKIESAKTIYGYLAPAIPRTDLIEMEYELTKAEDVCRRNEIWYRKDGDKFDQEYCAMYKKIHNEYEIQVNKVLGIAAIRQKLQDLISPMAAAGNVEISLTCDHFTGCYPLNRFLALLLANYLNLSGVPVLLTNKGLKSISPYLSTHICGQVPVPSAHADYSRLSALQGGAPTFPPDHMDFISETALQCDKYEHNVELHNGSDCRYPSGGVPLLVSYPYRNIFLRFGIDKMNSGYHPGPRLPGQQYVPYRWG